MVLIHGGTFAGGDPNGKNLSDNFPGHIVKLDSFYMDDYEVMV